MYEALAAIAPKNTGIAMNVSGSVGVTPSSNVAHRLRESERPHEAGADADRAQSKPVPHHERKDENAGCPERHSQAELGRALPDGRGVRARRRAGQERGSPACGA